MQAYKLQHIICERPEEDTIVGERYKALWNQLPWRETPLSLGCCLSAMADDMQRTRLHKASVKELSAPR